MLLAVGNPVTKLDPRGLRITMLYDAANRLTSRRYADGRRNTFAYDAVGNRTLMLDSTGRTTTTYSARSEVSCVAHPGDKRISYSYDAVSRRSVMTEPEGGRFTYSHDAAGRLSGVTNRKSSGDAISSFAYAYDNAGNRTGVVEANGVRTSWSYDKTYQLTHEHRGGHFAFNVTYTYDAAGNRLVQEDSGALTTYTYDAANQILTEQSVAGTTTYTHDAAGNRSQKEASEGTTYYAWDEDNRMVAAEPPAGTVTMTYTAAGARVRKESVTDTKRFLYDFNNLLAELDADNQTDKLYTQTVEEYGDLLSNDHGDHTDYYAYDGLGSTDALVDDTETLLARHAYRAFGLEQSGGDPNTLFAFVGRQGYYRDEEIDLYLLGAASGGRHYDPAAGRFTCKDRIRNDLNEYRYVGNRPSTSADPSGWQHYDWPTGDPPVCPISPSGGTCPQRPVYGPSPYMPRPLPADPRAIPPDATRQTFPPGVFGPAPVTLIAPPSPPPPAFPTTPGSKTGKIANQRGNHGPWCCWWGKSKASRLKPIKGVITGGSIPPSVTGGNHVFYSPPYAQPRIGGGGATPCIIAVVRCPSGIAVFHFSPGDDPDDTIDAYTWPSGCEAIVCGGDDNKITQQSNCIADDTISQLKDEGITVVGVSASDACGWEVGTKEKPGRWYQSNREEWSTGSTTIPSDPGQ